MAPKYRCKSCNRVFYGWDSSDQCPNCGGKLREVNSDNKKYPDNRKHKKDIKEISNMARGD